MKPSKTTHESYMEQLEKLLCRRNLTFEIAFQAGWTAGANECSRVIKEYTEEAK